MPAIALRKEIVSIKTSPPHPAAAILGAKADAAKARLEATGYRRAQAPECRDSHDRSH